MSITSAALTILGSQRHRTSGLMPDTCLTALHPVIEGLDYEMLFLVPPIQSRLSAGAGRYKEFPVTEFNQTSLES